MRPHVDLVIINDTTLPKTGGDRVYAVMKQELVRRGYEVSEVSIPLLMGHIGTQETTSVIGRTYSFSAELLANLLCQASSFKKFVAGSHLIVTSSCPAFPVFGHLTYHQPKAGILTPFSRESSNIKRMIAYRMQENERLSPLWLLVKKLIRLHLSNSKFTRDLVKRIYGVDSNVLYPPVPVGKFLHIDLSCRRKPYLLITRPEAITGISLLPKIARSLPEGIKCIIIGKIDRAGSKALHALKHVGAEFEYFGYVTEEVKMDILSKCSIYINLAVNESFGITVIEALAAGCVPIAHDSGGIREYLPSYLLYSTFDEAAEKVATYVESKSSIRKDLRNISLKFDEAIFRERFIVFVRSLETSLGLDSTEELSINTSPVTASEF